MFRESSWNPGIEKSFERFSVFAFRFKSLAEKEVTGAHVVGDAEAAPPSAQDSIVSHGNGNATIKAPDKPGAYRLFVVVRDGKRGASADNIPFFVER